jgi:hypothetical protein
MVAAQLTTVTWGLIASLWSILTFDKILEAQVPSDSMLTNACINFTITYTSEHPARCVIKHMRPWWHRSPLSSLWGLLSSLQSVLTFLLTMWDPPGPSPQWFNNDICKHRLTIPDTLGHPASMQSRPQGQYSTQPSLSTVSQTKTPS